MFEKETYRSECYMTMGLVAVNLIVFFLYEVIGSNLDTEFMLNHGAMYTPYIKNSSEWYRYFTALFLHFGIRHLLNNMLLLYVLGNYLERYLGKIKFLILYLVSGVGANIISGVISYNQGQAVVSAGASGAVFAVLGGLIWVILSNRGRLENLTAAKMVFMAVLALYYGFSNPGVDNVAHVAGLLLGFILSVLLYRKKSSRIVRAAL